MIYPVVIYLMDFSSGRSKELYFLTVVVIGLLIFHAMPE